jgi:hypothetical protein
MVGRALATGHSEASAEAIAETHIALKDAGVPDAEIAHAMLSGFVSIASDDPDAWLATLQLSQVNDLIKSVMPGLNMLGLAQDTDVLAGVSGGIDRFNSWASRERFRPAGTGGPRRGGRRAPTDVGTITDPISLVHYPVSGDGKSAKTRADALQREIQQIKERTAALQGETEAQRGLNPLVEDYGFAVAKAGAMADLLAAAEREQIEVTPALSAQFEQLATAEAMATAEAGRLAESQDDLRERMESMRDLGKDVMRGFVDDMVAGKSATEALTGALDKVGSKLLDVAFDGLFAGKAGGGGLLSMLFGGPKLGVGLYHGGGVAGAPRSLRAVDPSIFAGARRYHTGGMALRPGEVPAILERGEVVIPRGVRSTAGGTAVSINVSIDARGADKDGLARVAGEVAKLRAELPSRAVQAIQQAKTSRVKGL